MAGSCASCVRLIHYHGTGCFHGDYTVGELPRSRLRSGWLERDEHLRGGASTAAIQIENSDFRKTVREILTQGPLRDAEY